MGYYYANKYNNHVIEALNVDHRKKIIEWWVSQGVKSSYKGNCVKYTNQGKRYYGIIDGDFDVFSSEYIAKHPEVSIMELPPIGPLFSHRYNNRVIESLNQEHGEKVISWWESQGIETFLTGGNTRENKFCTRFYGIIDGHFDNYDENQLKNALVIEIPDKNITGGKLSNHKYNDCVIEALNQEHGEKVISWWKSQGIKTILTGGNTRENTMPQRFYGIINGHFDKYSESDIILPVIKMDIPENDFLKKYENCYIEAIDRSDPEKIIKWFTENGALNKENLKGTNYKNRRDVSRYYGMRDGILCLFSKSNISVYGGKIIDLPNNKQDMPDIPFKKKYENCYIEALDPTHEKEILTWFNINGYWTENFKGNTKSSGSHHRFYGSHNGQLVCYSNNFVSAYSGKIIDLPNNKQDMTNISFTEKYENCYIESLDSKHEQQIINWFSVNGAETGNFRGNTKSSGAPHRFYGLRHGVFVCYTEDYVNLLEGKILDLSTDFLTDCKQDISAIKEYENCYVEALTREHSKKIIKFFMQKGATNRNRICGGTTNNLEDNHVARFYGIWDYNIEIKTEIAIELQKGKIIKLPEDMEFAKKYENCYIEALNSEHGKKIINWFTENGIKNPSCWEGKNSLENDQSGRFYGILNSVINLKTELSIKERNGKIIKLPENTKSFFEIGQDFINNSKKQKNEHHKGNSITVRKVQAAITPGQRITGNRISGKRGTASVTSRCISNKAIIGR